MKFVKPIGPMTGVELAEGCDPRHPDSWNLQYRDIEPDYRSQISWNLAALKASTGVEAYVYKLRGQWMFLAGSGVALTFGRGRRRELAMVLNVIDSFALGYEFESNRARTTQQMQQLRLF